MWHGWLVVKDDEFLKDLDNGYRLRPMIEGPTPGLESTNRSDMPSGPAMSNSDAFQTAPAPRLRGKARPPEDPAARDVPTRPRRPGLRPVPDHEPQGRRGHDVSGPGPAAAGQGRAAAYRQRRTDPAGRGTEGRPQAGPRAGPRPRCRNPAHDRRVEPTARRDEEGRGPPRPTFTTTSPTSSPATTPRATSSRSAAIRAAVGPPTSFPTTARK